MRPDCELHCWIPTEHDNALKAIADRTCTTKSHIVRELIRAWLEQQGEPARLQAQVQCAPVAKRLCGIDPIAWTV